MNIAVSTTTLPSLVDRASQALQQARSSAEILEAREMAALAYDIAKKTARLAKAKNAHDNLIAAAHRAQADALEIEAGAKRRLADEYDAAQERGEIKTRADNQHASSGAEEAASITDIGLTHKDIHEARIIRDAEVIEPGIIRRELDRALQAAEEPTKANVRRVALKATTRHRGARFEAPKETQHDRDLRMLMGIWEAACESARDEFLKIIQED